MLIVFLLKRLGLTALTVICATFLTFLMVRMTPGDPAELILRKVFVGMEAYNADQTSKKAIEHRFGLSLPLYRQYGTWLFNAIRGNFGYSFRSGQRVIEEISLRIWPTLVLSFTAVGLSFIMTLIFGTMMSLVRYPFIKRILDTGIVASIAVPNFYLALMLILIFSIYLDFLPISGYGGLAYFTLPVTTLALTLFGYTTTILNDAVTNIRGQEFILTARGKGLNPFSIFYRHILRNAMVPVVPYVALQLGYALGGVVIVESVFAWPGIGTYLVTSIQTRDMPAIQACITFIALSFSLANVLADLTVWWLDPRVRLSV